VGEGRGRGYTVNLALPAGCGDAEYAVLYREVVAPIGRRFDPQLVLVSAGFDPHVDDPLAGMRLTAAGFGEVMGACLDAAGDAKVVVALEGGYDLEGIASSSAELVRRLRGERGAVVASERSAFGDHLVSEYRRFFSSFWSLA
jgi:acetoin utilization deacetylase AcuC-like enzyme